MPVAEQFKKVGDIIRKDPSRRYVVPSAPVNVFSDDTKVTDMLYSCYAAAVKEKKFTELLDKIKERYQEIIDGLGLDFSLDEDFDIIRVNFSKKIGTGLRGFPGRISERKGYGGLPGL